jgi:SulP family sulfate permease
MRAAHIEPGEKIFSINDTGREIYFIRKGNVRIELPLDNGTAHHLATFSRGAFFGDMAFLDNQPRSADARAEALGELYVLARRTFDHIMVQHPDVAGIFFERLALEIARRLRLNVSEMKALQEG